MFSHSAYPDLYRYQALDETKQQICFIKLEKGSSELTPRCSIRAFNLASAPKYIALSYTWGPLNPSWKIFVDGKAFIIRDNLYNFLRSFQTGSAVRTDIEYVYIGQICINQDNLQERNSQSSLVVVWLGNEPRMVKAARDIESDMEDADELHIRLLIGDYQMHWEAARFVAESIDPMRPVNSLGTLKDLFKEKDRKNEWRLDTIIRKYSAHERQDPRDKVYGFLGMVPAWQRPVVNYSKSMHQVFLDVVPIILDIYWKNKPREFITNTRFYGHFRVYLEYMLKLAWNMKFPDHDQCGLVSLFEEIVDVEAQLSKSPEAALLTLTDVIDGLGYEVVNPGSTVEGKGILKGRWWMTMGRQKYNYECRTSMHPLRKEDAWRFLGNVQKKQTWPGKEAEEESLRRLLDPNDPYPYDRPTPGSQRDRRGE
ncbi:HET-domain-containing protein [Xylaria sp. FL0043]|nr:HET-domain-containing protein [Xylaria sp. FL0043]